MINNNGKIVLIREKSVVGCAIKVEIIVDGVTRHKLKNGETIAIDLVYGQHEIALKTPNGLITSYTININEQSNYIELPTRIVMRPYNQGYAEFSNIVVGQRDMSNVNTNNISAKYNKTFQTDKKKFFNTSLVLSIVSVIIILSEIVLEITFAPYFIILISIWSIATGVISIVDAKDKKAIIPIIISLGCLIISFILYMN